MNGAIVLLKKHSPTCYVVSRCFYEFLRSTYKSDSFRNVHTSIRLQLAVRNIIQNLLLFTVCNSRYS